MIQPCGRHRVIKVAPPTGGQVYTHTFVMYYPSPGGSALCCPPPPATATCCRLAPSTAVVYPVALGSATVTVDVDDNNNDDPSFNAPSPTSHSRAPPSFTTTRKLHCGVCCCPSQDRHNGHGCGQGAPPVNQVSNAPIIHTASAGQDLD